MYSYSLPNIGDSDSSPQKRPFWKLPKFPRHLGKFPNFPGNWESPQITMELSPMPGNLGNFHYFGQRPPSDFHRNMGNLVQFPNYPNFPDI